MAQSKNPGFPQFFTNANSADDARRQFIEAPLDAVGPAALATGLELARLLSILPNAFVESQKRELKRLQATAGETDERIALLQSSIEDAEELRTFVDRGRVRAQRTVSAFADTEEVFHGFVSDANLSPLAGVTVRLKGGKSERGKTSAKTDADGYFSIPLRAKKTRAAGAQTFSERINKMVDVQTPASTIRPAEGKRTVTASVEIVRKSELLHEDPVPLILDEGTVYREYVVGENLSTAKDLDEFTSTLAETGEKG